MKRHLIKLKMKGKDKWIALTAYDSITASWIDEASVFSIGW